MINLLEDSVFFIQDLEHELIVVWLFFFIVKGCFILNLLHWLTLLDKHIFFFKLILFCRFVSTNY